MSTDQHNLTPEHPAYPPALRHWLGADAPPTLGERGRRILGAETARLRSLVQAAEQQPAAEGI
jgi:hypothetical protein